jgi:solute:Na+ symporter, SSS family
MNISLLDMSVILVYILVVLGFGIYLSRKEGSEGYFTNNRKTKLFFLVFSAVATSVGATSVIGIASSGFQNGISFGLLFAVASILGWSLVAYLAPKIKKFGDENKAFTFGDYLFKQYSNRTRKIGRLVVLLAYFFATAIQFVAFAQLIHVTTNLSYIPALFIVALVTITYTAFSGIRGDIYTDVLQFFVMIPIFIFIFIKGFALINLNQLLTLPEGYLNIYNYNGPIFFWAGVLFGFPIILVAVEAWQKVFAAVDQKTARTAFFWTGILKVIVIGASIVIGLFAFHLVPGAPADGAIFSLMAKILPSGLLGLGLASLLAIIMSTVDSGIMVGSATVTKDFYLAKYPDATEKKILFVGRLATVAFGLSTFLVAYFVNDIIALALISTQILLIFAPALLGGLVWNVNNEKSAFWSISLGTAVTLVTMIFDMNMAFVPGVLVAIVAYVIPLFLKRKQTKEIEKALNKI